MKKATAVILSLIIGVSCFAGVSLTYADAETELVTSVQSMLYGMYTKQSGDRLRDSYNKVAAGIEGDLAELKTAADSLRPLVYTKSILLGFDKITSDDILNMPLNKGEVTVSDGVISIAGTNELRYCNAVEEGISGPTPFGMEMITCDGFVITVDSDKRSSLDFEVGKRGSSNDCKYGIYDICVSEGRNTFFFPFECFGDIPLDGTLNYFSMSFTGADNVSVSDFHAAESAAETAVKTEKTKKKMTTPEFNSEKSYRIYKKGTTEVLTYNPDEDINVMIKFTPENINDDSQEWQICDDPDVSGRKRIINRKYGMALCIEANPMSLKCKTPSLRDTNQQWGIGFQKSKGYSFYVQGNGRLTFKDEKARAAATSSTVVYFDVYELSAGEYNLAWEENFDTLDRSVWKVFDEKNRGDMEPMYNRDSPNNVYIENGNLVIKTIKEEYNGYHATSGYLSTEFNVHFSYGRIDVYARMPEGTKIWPAVWMMGDDDDWPFSGEWDVVEMTGGPENSVNRGDMGVLGTFHYANAGGYHTETGGGTETFFNTEKLALKYHTYSMEWDANYIRWYFDDLMYHSKPYDSDVIRQAILKNPAYLILDTSIDGPGDNELPEGMPDESYFYIDRIRYYKKTTAGAPEEVDANVLNIKPIIDTTQSGVARDPKFNADSGIYMLPSYTATCKLFDMNEVKEKLSVGVPETGDETQTMLAAISLDGTKFAYGSALQFIAVFSYPDGKLIKVIDDIPMHCGKMEFTADGRNIILCTRPGSGKGTEYAEQLHIISVDTGKEVKTIDLGGWGSLIKVAKSGRFAVGMYNGTVKVFDKDFTLKSETKLNSGINAIEFGNDDSVVYIGCGNGQLYSIDISSDVKKFITITDDEVFDLAVSHDGKNVAAAYGDGFLRIFDVSTGKLLTKVSTGHLAATGCAYSPDGKIIAVSSDNGKVVLFKADGSKTLAVLTSDETPYCNFDCVTFTSDGKMVYSSRNRLPFSCGICGWELPDNLVPEETYADFSELKAENTYVDEMLWSKDSYEEYIVAEKRATTVIQNKYSSKVDIDSALADLKAAKAGLTEEQDIMKGDFDNDMEITVADALAALRIAAKLVPEDAKAIAVGDVDGDNHITVADALAILRVAAKLTDNL